MLLGIDRIDEYLDLFKGKRVGLITNPTGVNSHLTSTIDILNEKVNLVALFSPEHGIRGNIQAGVNLDTYIDEKTGITVYSLFGKNHKPTKEMMDSVDILCIDIQDVGSRFYTFLYTMSYAMEACKEYDKEFLVFDRPNPINASSFEGNILDMKYKSFVGGEPILQRYGLTFGEAALLFNLEYKIGCKLHVIKMEGYDRTKYFDELGLSWISPSPNIPTVFSAVCYNATCQFEGTNISEGRGTTTPFELIGAPFINPYDLADNLNKLNLGGVYFRPLYFTPTFSKYEGEMCGGVFLHILDRNSFNTVRVSWVMIDVIIKMYPDDFKINPSKGIRPCFFDLENGASFIREETLNIDEQLKLLEKETKEFGENRKKYLIY